MSRGLGCLRSCRKQHPAGGAGNDMINAAAAHPDLERVVARAPAVRERVVRRRPHAQPRRQRAREHRAPPQILRDRARQVHAALRRVVEQHLLLQLGGRLLLPALHEVDHNIVRGGALDARVDVVPRLARAAVLGAEAWGGTGGGRGGGGVWRTKEQRQMMRRWGAVQCSQGGVGGGGGPLQRLRRRRQLRTLDARLVEVGGVRAAGAVAAEDGVLAGVVAVVLFVCLLLFGRIGQLIVRQAADGQTRCVRCAAAPPCPPPPRPPRARTGRRRGRGRRRTRRRGAATARRGARPAARRPAVARRRRSSSGGACTSCA